MASRLKRLRQHTNPLAFQGLRTRPDWAALLGGPPRALEIGFGLGELLLARAAARRGVRHLGLDVRWAYVEKARAEAARLDPPLTNLALLHAEGHLALSSWFEPGSLDEVVVYFPDPWFKRRHAKRRIIRPDTVPLLERALAPGGLLHVATDQEPLAREMLALLGAAPGLRNAAGAGRFAEESGLGAQSAREIEHLARGERIWRLRFERAP